MIAFRNFALRRGERLLLSDVDLALHAGWRVGVVGRNGTGKSSLFALLRGELLADLAGRPGGDHPVERKRGDGTPDGGEPRYADCR